VEHRTAQNDWWAVAVLAVGFVVIGSISLVADLRGYGRWPRMQATVVRVASGFGWKVPEYRAACYAGMDEVSGAKFTLVDGTPPSVGERLTVACQPVAEGMHAYSVADYRALLRRDVFFVLVGVAAGVVALRRRRRSQ
jgi:hypothetical protein